MLAPLYVGLSTQRVLNRKMDTIAFNIANAGTPGFRAEQIRFEELVARPANVSFPSGGGSEISQVGGPIIQTKGKWDVSIVGDGWFAVQGGGGRVYTRDGRFSLTSTGALVSVNGASVLDVGGGPIVLDPAGPQPVIARDGMIQQGAVSVGAIGLFRFPPQAQLERAEGSAVRSSDEPAPITDFTKDGVRQGYVENSNVNPVEQLAKLIQVQRQFEMVSGSTQASEMSLAEAIRMLGPS